MAIAHDTSKSDSLGVNGTNLTTSFTTGSGTHRIMFIAFGYAGGASVSSVTYNGVAATNLASLAQDSIQRHLYVLLSPATGAHNVSITVSTDSNLSASIATYTGVIQSTTMNDNDTTAASSTTEITVNQTTTLDNCWQLSYHYISGGTPTYPAALSKIATANNEEFRHTNAALTPAGAYNRVWSTTSGSTMEAILVAFAPYTASTATITDSMTMTEVNTSFIKRILTLLDSVTMTEVLTAVRSIWKTVAKAATSWSTTSKNATSWTNGTKNETTWTNGNKTDNPS